MDDLPVHVVLERAQLVSQAAPRMPYMGVYGRYNKRWYVDIVTLPDNALRCLLAAAFSVVGAARCLALDLSAGDFEMMFAFFAQFGTFTRALLTAERSVLFAEVEHALRKRPDYDTHALHPAQRARTAAQVHTMLDQLQDARAQRHMSSVRAVHSMQTALEALCSTLLQYFSVKESVLPRILFRSFRGAKEKNRMEARLIHCLQQETGRQFYMSALLTLPLNTEQVRADFEQRHFSKRGQAQQYRDAVHAVRSALMAIPTQFESAGREYEQRFSLQTFVDKYGTDRDAHANTQLVETQPSK
ncbi:unnamed protein product [Agarophyton chilense]